MNLFAAVNEGMAIAALEYGKKHNTKVVVAKREEALPCDSYSECFFCPKFKNGKCEDSFV